MISAFFTSILGLIYFYISRAVILQRRSQKIGLGTGPNEEISALVSAHSNFNAYVPLLIILMFFLEHLIELNRFFLVCLGIVIVLGRLLHFKAMSMSAPLSAPALKYRIAGMIMTLIPLVLMSFIILVASVLKWFT